jgi:hypothetical protein
MARLYKIVLYAVDFNDMYDLDSIKSVISDIDDVIVIYDTEKEKEVDFVFHDDHILNCYDVKVQDIEEFFITQSEVNILNRNTKEYYYKLNYKYIFRMVTPFIIELEITELGVKETLNFQLPPKTDQLYEIALDYKRQAISDLVDSGKEVQLPSKK